MSTVFLAPTGQPMSQRPRFSQPPWRTPLNGCSRSSPKWTAIGSRSVVRPARAPAAANARSFGRSGWSGVVTGSSAASVMSYHGSSPARVIAAGQPASNTSAGARSCTLA